MRLLNKYFHGAIWPKLLLAMCLFINIKLVFIGWNNQLLSDNNWKQTQTAIATYYFLKDGISFNYQTPVLGYPWAIPFEFPVYQIIVALLCKITLLPLEQTGRAVSLIFFYLSVFVFFLLIKGFVKNKSMAYVGASFFLLSPIYISLSRAFMIESTALFFTLSFIFFAIKFLKKNNWQIFLFAVFSGSLAGLAKITTFFIGIAFFMFWLLYISTQANYNKFKRSTFIFVMLLFLIPSIISIAWINTADAIKAENPVGASLVSRKLMPWNFGTINQRLNSAVWVQSCNFGLYQIFNLQITEVTQVFILAIVLILTGIFFLFYSPLVTVFLLTYVSAPLIFTNLFYLHAYYWYENSLYLIGAIILILDFIFNKKYLKWFDYFLILFLLLVSLNTFFVLFYYNQAYNSQPEVLQATAFIKSATKDTDIMLVYGQDWDTTYAYYAQRKAIMAAHWMADESVKQMIANTGTANIKCIVFDNRNHEFNEAYIHCVLKDNAFSFQAAYSENDISIYISKLGF